MVVKRVKAFMFDYLLILSYMFVLFIVTILISKIFVLRLNNSNPIIEELTGFFTLTLPVILYFSFTENGSYAGSFGKRRFQLKVVSQDLSKASLLQLLVRNFIKLFPWELAHYYLFRLFYFIRTSYQGPTWVVNGLIVSMGLALVYLLFIVFNKSHRSVYELISGTKVIHDNGTRA